MGPNDVTIEMIEDFHEICTIKMLSSVRQTIDFFEDAFIEGGKIEDYGRPTHAELYVGSKLAYTLLVDDAMQDAEPEQAVGRFGLFSVLAAKRMNYEPAGILAFFSNADYDPETGWAARETKSLLSVVRMRESENWSATDFLIIEDPNIEPESALREAVCEYLHTEEGQQMIEYTAEDFNWGDALASVPDEMLRLHGLSYFDSLRKYDISGEIKSLLVNQDEVLVQAEHIGIHEDKSFSIVPLYANAVQGDKSKLIYGDIYETKDEAAREHAGSDILLGFGLKDPKTGKLFDDSPDWFWTVNDALGYVNEKERV